MCVCVRACVCVSKVKDNDNERLNIGKNNERQSALSESFEKIHFPTSNTLNFQ